MPELPFAVSEYCSLLFVEKKVINKIMSCCYSYSNLFVYPGTRNTPKSEEADEEESVQVSCLKEPLRWTILLPLAGRAGTGH